MAVFHAAWYRCRQIRVTSPLLFGTLFLLFFLYFLYFAFFNIFDSVWSPVSLSPPVHWSSAMLSQEDWPYYQTPHCDITAERVKKVDTTANAEMPEKPKASSYIVPIMAHHFGVVAPMFSPETVHYPLPSSSSSSTSATSFLYEMYVHNFDRDEYISKGLSNGRMWELHNIDIMLYQLNHTKYERAMKHDYRIPVYVDIGANIGVHVFAIAAAGYQSHAIEALSNNVALLSCTASLSENSHKFRFSPSISHVAFTSNIQNISKPFLCLQSDNSNIGHTKVLNQDNSNTVTADSEQANENTDTAICAGGPYAPLSTLDIFWRTAMKQTHIDVLKVR